MTKKFYVASVFLALTFTLNSCLSESSVNQTKQNQSFNIQSGGSEPKAVPTSGPSDIKTALANRSEPDRPLIYESVNSQPDEKPFVDFSNTELPKISIEDYAKYDIIPGQIQVVFKDEYDIKINKNEAATSKLVSVKNSLAAEQLNRLLTNKQIKKAFDMAQNMSEQEVFSDQEAIKRNSRGYIPSRYSLQTYTFSDDRECQENGVNLSFSSDKFVDAFSKMNG